MARNILKNEVVNDFGGYIIDRDETIAELTKKTGHTYKSILKYVKKLKGTGYIKDASILELII
jgi:hypothetical protein